MQVDLRTALGAVVRAESPESLASATCTSLATSRSVILARMWIEERSGRLALRGSAGTPSGGGNYSRTDGEFRDMAIGDSKIREIAASREPLVVAGLRGDEEWLLNPSWAARQGARAFIALPLIERDAVFGVLAIFDRAVLSNDVLAQLHLVADIAAARLAHLARAVMTRAEVRRAEKDNIEAALAQTDGKLFGADGAASLLGMKPTTLASRIKALGVRRPAGAAQARSRSSSRAPSTPSS